MSRRGSSPEIPDELIGLAAEGRLIPFLGAGFSGSLGLPSWEAMLKDLCQRLPGSLPYETIHSATNGDFLQIAEYLFVKADREIGPIRHQLERALANHDSPLLSGPHVELVNLGASQIYTTNYDDLIEATYRELGLPVQPVILAKDVALAEAERTQVVKYHGDLAHERTLVLTESAYYKRLDFESPMDLKFRSDLLGKSVIFIGYSFRDVNIRLIWFRLMEMMTDIPEADRRPSYIVRVEPTPALDELDAAVGLRTIVLSPDAPVRDASRRAALLGNFLLELGMRAGTRPLDLPVARGTIFVSAAALATASQRLEHYGPSLPAHVEEPFRYGGFLFNPQEPLISRILGGTVPSGLEELWQKTVLQILPEISVSGSLDYPNIFDRMSPSVELTESIVGYLAIQGSKDARSTKRALTRNRDLWPRVWAFPVSPTIATRVLNSLEREVFEQALRTADDDIAYLADLGKRIESGSLLSRPADPAIKVRAANLLKRAALIYPSISKLRPPTDGPPEIREILREIDERASDFRPVGEAVDSSLVGGASRNPVERGAAPTNGSPGASIAKQKRSRPIGS